MKNIKNYQQHLLFYHSPNKMLRASTLDVVNVPNAKYLAHLAHQTPKNPIYQMFQIS